MSRAAFDYEFAFGCRTRRSTAWKVVVPRRRADVYLSNLDGGGEFHVSLHEKGRCHLKELPSSKPLGSGPWGGRKTIEVALPRGMALGKPSGYDDYKDIWYPKELAPGIRMPFRIGVATSQLRLLPLEIADRPQLHFVAVAEQAESFNEVAFFVSDQDAPSGSWPARTSLGTQLLAKHPLPNGLFLWVTSRSHPQSRESVMWTHAYRPSVSPSPEMDEVDRTSEDLSALIMTRDDQYGSYVIWETGE